MTNVHEAEKLARSGYTPTEWQICSLSRELRNGETLVVGNQSPIAAAAVFLAQATHAPQCVPIVLGDADSWPFEGTDEFFAFIQRGQADVFFLGGAQIDPYGNINLHAIGDYGRPKVRLPGGAGAAMVYYRSKRIYLFKNDHQAKGFPERLDFVSSSALPAYRESGSGVLAAVFTPIAVLRPDPATGRLKLDGTAPGISAGEVQSRTGFDIAAGSGVLVLEPPTEEELKTLRTVVRRRMERIYPAFAQGGLD